MRTVIVCLTLMLASGGVAAEQVKSPKRITKTSVMKRAPQPVVAQRVPARKKVINSVASKPTVVASQKRVSSKTRRKPVGMTPAKLGAKQSQAITRIKTAALKPATKPREKPTDEPKNITPAAVKPAAKPHTPALFKRPFANELFGAVSEPAPLVSRSIGSYSKGCLAGGVALPINGEAWQVMRASRNRNWGNPCLIAYIEQFAADAQTIDHWPGLLVGDMSQPRGGPMLFGHSSHQIGLDVDFWLTPMPDNALTPEERERSVVASGAESRRAEFPVVIATGIASSADFSTMDRFRPASERSIPRKRRSSGVSLRSTLTGWRPGRSPRASIVRPSRARAEANGTPPRSMATGSAATESSTTSSTPAGLPTTGSAS